jgi:hypothetical protein
MNLVLVSIGYLLTVLTTPTATEYIELIVFAFIFPILNAISILGYNLQQLITLVAKYYITQRRQRSALFHNSA